MFSLGEAYERFMGRWSRKLAPLLVQLQELPTATPSWTSDPGREH